MESKSCWRWGNIQLHRWQTRAQSVTLQFLDAQLDAQTGRPKSPLRRLNARFLWVVTHAKAAKVSLDGLCRCVAFA
jgi:hypothetical protein